MPFLPESEKKQCVRFALAFAGVIVGWAILHDIHLIQVEPKHFTEYHRKVLSLSHPTFLAIQYAVIATLGPGLLFGFMAWIAARWGSRPQKGLGETLGGFAVLLVVIEAVLLGIGSHALHQFDQNLPLPYPEDFYPELSRGIAYTQSVNISAYLIAPITGFLYLSLVFHRRKKISA